ncbi:hydantoinase B/oxoprolinase family protein [Vibrio viridaestus]|uniref:Hydantoinase B/oxoprolinase family protein n=1 Tax=Vibrio viridaestus TaxID=2487322 RepID=A0A3N9TDX6_9VIBR|nr:hydantoinase B/oxoprolinase family protein [Vibrio viridaestus]RQW61903.1 hydantoinase B/oxoprolinase family protein [Vibrio viridaestus]
MGHANTTDRIDPVTLSIMANRLHSITREMTNTMIRTARSTTMAARDFSCSINSSDHQLLSAPGAIPVHVYGSSLVSQVMERKHPNFKEGDAYLHNDPYDGNTHAADHTLMVPVFFQGEHVFTVLAKAHQVDAGCALPTTYMPKAKDVYEEGAIIFPCVKIQDQNKDIEDIIGIARLRIRAFDTWYGDYLASLGALRLAEKRLQDFCASFDSIEQVRAFVKEWLDYGERMAIAGIEKLPEGRLDVKTHMDAFPGLPDGLDLQATIEIKPNEGKVVIDLRNNPDCTPTGLNLTEATSKNNAVTAVLMALNTDKNATSLHVPNNSGSHRPIEVLVRENCVVGIPRHPASCSAATRTVTDRVTGMLLAGIASMSEQDIGAAEPPLGCPPHEAVVSGRDPRRDNEEYILQIFSGSSGGPATADSDGWLAFATIMGAGIPRIDSSEIVEQRYPLVVWQHASVRADSEGAGYHRGATGTTSAYGPRLAKAESHYYLEGVQNRPKGVHGGGIAAGPESWVVKANGESIQMSDIVAEVKLDNKDTIFSLGSGAGGYGSPLTRETEKVLEDVMDEYISVERAKSAYGVVIEGDVKRWETLYINVAATESLRAEMISLNRGETEFDGGRQSWIAPNWFLNASRQTAEGESH